MCASCFGGYTASGRKGNSDGGLGSRYVRNWKVCFCEEQKQDYAENIIGAQLCPKMKRKEFFSGIPDENRYSYVE